LRFRQLVDRGAHGHDDLSNPHQTLVGNSCHSVEHRLKACLRDRKHVTNVMTGFHHVGAAGTLVGLYLREELLQLHGRHLVVCRQLTMRVIETSLQSKSKRTRDRFFIRHRVLTTRIDLVADAIHGHKIRRFSRIRLDLVPQMIDMTIERAFEDASVIVQQVEHL
jgi:hypothetical protein